MAVLVKLMIQSVIVQNNWRCFMDLNVAREDLRAQGIDALVAIAPESVQALSGVHYPMHRLLPERWIVAVVPAMGQPWLSVTEFDAPKSSLESWETVLRKNDRDGASTLCHELRERRLRRVAIDLGTCTAAQARRVRECLDGEVVDGSSLIRRLRSIKDENEIELLREAAVKTREATLTALSSGLEGSTYADVARRIRLELVRNGSEAPAFVVIGSNQMAEVAHPVASDEAVMRGQLVRCDVGGWFGGWASDLAWTFGVGPVSESVRSVYSALRQALQDVTSSLRPGAMASAVYQQAVRSLDEVGLTLAVPHVGHGIGLGVHDGPALSPTSQDELEPGNVICVELVTIHAGDRFHLEETIAITDSGRTYLSSPLAPEQLPRVY